MRKRQRPPHGAARQLPPEIAGEVFGEFVHAADGRHDPEIIADADGAVGAPEALKGPARLARVELRRSRRSVAVFEFAGKAGLQVVSMHELAGPDLPRRIADRHVVLDHRTLGRNGGEREFVAAPNRLRQRDGQAVRLAPLSGGEVGQRDGDIIGAPDPDVTGSFGHGSRLQQLADRGGDAVVLNGFQIRGRASVKPGT